MPKYTYSKRQTQCQFMRELYVALVSHMRNQIVRCDGGLHDVRICDTIRQPNTIWMQQTDMHIHTLSYTWTRRERVIRIPDRDIVCWYFAHIRRYFNKPRAATIARQRCWAMQFEITVKLRTVYAAVFNSFKCYNAEQLACIFCCISFSFFSLLLWSSMWKSSKQWTRLFRCSLLSFRTIMRHTWNRSEYQKRNRSDGCCRRRFMKPRCFGSIDLFF